VGRARNPARDKAYEMWAKSEGKGKIKDIAVALNVLDSQVRKWKSEDKWEQKLKERSKKERSDKPLRKKGAPKGNKNAAGNKGGSAPIGNQNSLKHGGYSTLFNKDVLTGDELTYYDSEDDLDTEMELIELIRTYHIRETRLLRAINKYEEENAAILTGQNRFEKKRSFASEDEKEQYQRIVQEKVDKGDRLPGESYDIQIYTEPKYKRIERLEAELTKVQRAKKEAIAELYAIRSAKIGSQKNAIADDWIATMMGLGDNDANV
jgi:uncharacterized protein YjcR